MWLILDTDCMWSCDVSLVGLAIVGPCDIDCMGSCVLSLVGLAIVGPCDTDCMWSCVLSLVVLAKDRTMWCFLACSGQGEWFWDEWST